MWDCPGGVDEINCKRISCPGFFKCHQSVICLAQNNICDNTTDCQFGDDEYFCQIKIPMCPDNCTCVLLDISIYLTVPLNLSIFNAYILCRIKSETGCNAREDEHIGQM